MSTHNIGFYEEISKIIPYLSSNIIKYAPYLFFCSLYSQLALLLLGTKRNPEITAGKLKIVH